MIIIYTHANRGLDLEELIKYQNMSYTKRNIAVIHKVPTEWIPIRGSNGKIITAKVVNKAAVDFMGVYKGIPIAFDAKHTKEARLSWKRLLPHQYEFLSRWEKCGGISFVLVGYDMKKYYVVPISEWGKEGKSVLLTDLKSVPMTGGLPDYLSVLKTQ